MGSSRAKSDCAKSKDETVLGEGSGIALLNGSGWRESLGLETGGRGRGKEKLKGGQI